MKERFLQYLEREIPDTPENRRLNKKPSYNNFRGIWSHLLPSLKQKYDSLSTSMVKVGIHESQMKKIAIMTDFFKDFIREA